MVISELEYGFGRIILRPNRSASWAANKCVLATVGGATLLVAFSWSLAGAWMVLPFAGLEVGLLGYFLLRVSQNTHWQQIITVTPERICVEAGNQKYSRQWVAERDHMHIVMTKPYHSLDGPSFLLCHGETSIRLGEFLNKDDRELLQPLLLSLGLRVQTREPHPEIHFDA